jgi:predicted neutral ceramidase superfamily lipid hydrolase
MSVMEKVTALRGREGQREEIPLAQRVGVPGAVLLKLPVSDRMAVTMKRLLGKILQVLLATLLVLYVADWIVLRVKTGGRGTSTVQVEQFLKSPLKNHKEEFDYLGTVAQPCVPSLFPHSSEAPCWWVARHKIQWVS